MTALSVLDLVPVRHGMGPREALQESAALAQHVEALGYTRFWVAEHHNMEGIASAATSVALACDEVVMSDGAFFMIHNAHGFAYGDKTELRHSADTMEKVEGAIVDDYVKKTGKTEEDVRALMQAETWFSAKEALENGFVDSIAETDKKLKNTWNLAAFGNAPAALKEPPPDPVDETPEQEPAPAGFFMSATNANRLRIAQIA